jgi:hypothetical protein
LRLVEIKINYKDDVYFILPLVKLLMVRSPVLLSLRVTGVNVDASVLKKLVQFKRASKEAEIWVD